ncbi:MAG: autotransporter outer membrane beta-barrel domain-containing protein [Alphaproteobacteria bacterium]|nr:autotransporter outer membrane beta-barrel domain-containing protein [Alphaproteobacteria bacterium]
MRLASRVLGPEDCDARATAPAGPSRRCRKVAAIVVPAVLLAAALSGAARAADECGPAEAGQALICSPATYDPTSGGNIFYGPDDTFEDDFEIRLTGDLSVRYDRDASGDDVLVRRGDGSGGSAEDRSRYGAVVIAPGGPDYGANISVSSAADIVSNGRGILVYHEGASGALRLDIPDGRIVTAGGGNGYAVVAHHTGSGNVSMVVEGAVVEAGGDNAIGIVGEHLGTGDIDAGVNDAAIEADGDLAVGIFSVHRGSGDIGARVRGGRIAATGRMRGNAGIWAQHTGSGDIAVAAEDAAIEAAASSTFGVFAGHWGSGNIGARVRGGGIAATGQAQGNGIWTFHAGQGDIAVAAEDVAIEAAGDIANGILVGHRGTGDVNVHVHGGRIVTTGQTQGSGIEAAGHAGSGGVAVAAEDVAIEAAGDIANGILVGHRGTGAVAIDVDGGRIGATGTRADGIDAIAVGDSIDIVAEDVAIEVRGTEYSNGIVAVDRAGGGGISIATRNVDIDVRAREGLGGKLLGGMFVSAGNPEEAAGHAGDSRIDVHGGSIRTAGEDSGAIQIVHNRGGSIAIDVREAVIEAGGDRAIGIEARHPGSGGGVRIRVEGGTLSVEGPGGHAISAGSFDEETGAVRAAGVGVDGYRRQHVTANGRVRGGGGAGVRLVGGGRVEVGPLGSVGAASGVAVLAEGDGAALRVEAQLDGRRMDEAITGEIRNDDGRTTVAVNGVVLHDGATGATGLRAPNGARDVTLAASATVAGRAFPASDFASGYAPRAAVYEALPGFMLHLDGRGTAGLRLRDPGSPAWVRASGGGGSWRADGASVGAAWDFTRFEAEAGLDFALSREGGVTGSVTLRHVRGSADVSAPTGGGKIEAAGFGASFGAAWENADGWYADGRISVSRYEVDLRSDGRGRLKDGAGVIARSLAMEAGRQFSFGEDLRLTPRAWLTGSDISMDGFRDAVRSRVSLRDSARTAAGVGLVAGTAHEWDNGERALVLRGHVGAERALGDRETAVEVSGERLAAASSRTRAVLGLGGVYRRGAWSFGGEVSASGPGSKDSLYAVGVRIGAQF